MRMTRLTARDTSRFHELCLDEHVRRYLLDGQEVSRDWASTEITKSEAAFEAGGLGLWLVHVGDEAVGFAGYRVFETLGPWPQLLYAFVEEVGGRGLGTATCGWLLEQARLLGWTQVESAVDAPNVASVRVLEKNGFIHRGVVPGEFGECVMLTWFAEPPPPPSLHGVLRVGHTWDGHPIDDRVEVSLAWGAQECIVTVDAPFHGDPPPTGSPGRQPGLWDHEVVEVMWLGADDKYFELELSPHGHYLALLLHGRRQVVDDSLTLFYEATVEGERWIGRARVPNVFVPPGCDRINAYAIHGEGPARRYWAWSPRRDAHADDVPDFHLLESFGPLSSV